MLTITLEQEQELKQTALYKNFQRGDLLYGLKGPRDTITPLLEEKTGSDHVWIDTYNNQYALLFDKNDNYSQEKEMEAIRQSRLTSDELAILENFKSSPIEKVRITNRHFNESKKGFGKSHRILRRGCKAGLLVPGITKHFLLDGLDPKVIFNKNNNLSFYNLFTSAEMRFIFRHWNKIKDSLVFYNQGQVEENMFRWLDAHGALEELKDYLDKRGIDQSTIVINTRKGEKITVDNWNKVALAPVAAQQNNMPRTNVFTVNNGPPNVKNKLLTRKRAKAGQSASRLSTLLQPALPLDERSISSQDRGKNALEETASNKRAGSEISPHSINRKKT